MRHFIAVISSGMDRSWRVRRGTGCCTFGIRGWFGRRRRVGHHQRTHRASLWRTLKNPPYSHNTAAGGQCTPLVSPTARCMTSKPKAAASGASPTNAPLSSHSIRPVPPPMLPAQEDGISSCRIWRRRIDRTTVGTPEIDEVGTTLEGTMRLAMSMGIGCCGRFIASVRKRKGQGWVVSGVNGSSVSRMGKTMFCSR